MFDFSRARTARSIDESLERIGCAYFDCVQVHDPEYHSGDVDGLAGEVLGGIDDARKLGKTRMTGITGFPLSIHMSLIRAAEKLSIEVHTAVSYCHLTLQNNTLETDLLPFLDEHKVAVINAAPVMMGVLSSGGPPSWNPASAPIKAAGAAAAKYCTDNGVELAELAVHFALAHERIPTTLISATSVDVMNSNLARVYALEDSASTCKRNSIRSHDGGECYQNAGTTAASSADGARGLSEKEARVMQHVVDHLLLPVRNLSWEGVQVQKYHEMVAQAKQGRQTGTIDTA
jgi:aryl-alcohol dehydrogenase-like predicted oxidoreductase